MVLVLRSGDQEVRHAYVVVPEGEGWRLASPVTLAMPRVPAADGRNVTVRDPSASAALLDSCVADMAGRLRIPPDRLAAIAQAKLGYLCIPAAEVKVYDYRLQMLVGLHAEGFWPSATFCSADRRRLEFTIIAPLAPTPPMSAVIVP